MNILKIKLFYEGKKKEKRYGGKERICPLMHDS